VKALESLSNGKAEGIDNIPEELLKELGSKAKDCLTEVCEDVYNTGIWPEDFTKAVIITLAKKQDASNCSGFRTTSLLTHASKVMIKVLQQRIESKVTTEKVVGKDQFGFVKVRGTREAIGSLRILADGKAHGTWQTASCLLCRL